MKKPRAGSATPRTDLSKGSGPTKPDAERSDQTISTPTAVETAGAGSAGTAPADMTRTETLGTGPVDDAATGGTAAEGRHHPEATLRFADTPAAVPPASDEPGLAAAVAAAESRRQDDAAAAAAGGEPAAVEEPEPTRVREYATADSGRPAEPVPPPSRRGGGRAGGIIAVVLLILILGALAATPFWAPIVVPLLPWGADQANRTEQQIQDVSRRVQALESRPAPQPADTSGLKSALDALDKRVSGIEQRVADIGSASASGGGGGVDLAEVQTLRNDVQQVRSDLQSQTAASDQKLNDLNQRIAGLDRKIDSRPAIDPAMVQSLQNDARKIAVAESELSDRVNRLESQASQQANTDRADQALLLAVGQLRNAVDSSRPYAAELGAVQALGRDRPNVLAAAQPLTARAQTGVPSVAVLRQRFNDTAKAVVQAEQSPPSQDFGEEVMGKLRSLVTVRRVGTAPEDRPAQGAVAQAESALDAGDLAGAVAALDKLSGPAAGAAKPWLDDAKARLAAEGSVAKLDQLLVARLTSEGGGSGSSSPSGVNAVTTGAK